ncbi:MAG: hypothetical protein ABSA09_00600 [Desulfobaccales bacterium]|jgi:hypothetical protein
MKKTILLLLAAGCFLLALAAYGGQWTANGYFYKPGLGASGQTESNLFNQGLDQADAQLASQASQAKISATLPLTYNSTTGVLAIPQASALVNGYLASGDWSAFNAKQPAISLGTTSQYWRGDKTWQTLNPAAVGAAPATSGTAILKGNNSGGFANAAAGADYQSPLTFSRSITNSSGTVTLSGDSSSPGNSMLYGTNGAGVKGWYSQPGGGSGMTYPGAGVPLCTGSAWGTSYAVGTSANDLVRLNASGQLPAVSGANLTNLTAAMVGAAPATSGTSILKGNGSGGTTAAVSNTDYAAVRDNGDPTYVWNGNYLLSRISDIWSSITGNLIVWGSNVYGTNLATVVSTIGSSTPANLIVPPGTFAISANVIITPNIRLLPQNGANISVPTGDTLTINGPFEAGPYQVFSCAGTGKVIFGNNVAEGYAEWWGAKGDGSTDDTAAWTAALASGAGRVRAIPGRNYFLNAALPVLSNTEFVATGATFTKGTNDTQILTLTGSTTATSTTLTSNGALWASSISVTSATGFNPGDYVLIYDNTYAWGSGPLVARNQEINRVLSTSTGTINLGNALIGSYATASTATVVKLAPIHDTRIQGGTYINPAGNSGGNIGLTLCFNVQVNDVTCIGPNDYYGLNVSQCAYVDINRITIKDGQILATVGYGVAFDDCHNCSLKNSYTENIRENSCTNFSRYILFENNTDRNAYDDSFNSHGTGNHHIWFANNTSINSRGGGLLQGYSSCPGADSDIYFINNKIINCGAYPYAVGTNSSQIANRVFIKGGSIYGCGYSTSAQPIYAGYVNDLEISGVSINGVTNNASAGILLVAVTKGRVLNNLIENFPNGYGIEFQTSCSDLEIRGNKFESVSSYQIYDNGFTGTNIRILDNNSADSTYVSIAAADIQSRNSWNPLPNITTALTPGSTVAITATAGDVYTLTPGQAESITVSAGTEGQDLYLKILTSGTSSYTLTFGTGFHSAGTLATGTSSGAVFMMHFKNIGGTFCEVSRTGAM